MRNGVANETGVSRPRSFGSAAVLVTAIGIALACHTTGRDRPDVDTPSGAIPSATDNAAAVTPELSGSPSRIDSATSDTLQPAQPSSAIQAALDSCQTIPAPDAAASTETADQARARLDGKVRDFGRFSLYVPDSARVIGPDSTDGGLRLEWPGCPRCSFGLGMSPDSGSGLDGYIARLIAEQRRIDSVNRDPATDIFEFDEIEGPPREFRTATGRGFLIDEACGDCASTTLLFGRPGDLARLNVSADVDVPQGARRMCEMTVVAMRFAWRR